MRSVAEQDEVGLFIAAAQCAWDNVMPFADDVIDAGLSVSDQGEVPSEVLAVRLEVDYRSLLVIWLGDYGPG